MAQLKRCYLFNEDMAALRKELSPQGRELKDLLGGKGANLCLMTNAGIPVPPGFTITTDTCNEYTELGELPAELADEVVAALAKLEEWVGKELGNPDNPLLVSLRSGAKFSMPGMMDTVLNLGLSDEIAHRLVALTGDARFVWDAYRRFIMMFGDVVKGIERGLFEQCLTTIKQQEGVTEDTEVSAEGLKQVVAMEKQVYKEHLGDDFPGDPQMQLFDTIRAVFESWNNDRAIAYRELNRIAHDLGTAVNVQTMVFGNMGEDSGTGVAFTRNPATGEQEIYGDYLINAQGEDVVAGIRTPMAIAELEQSMPEIYQEFTGICQKLEHFYHDVQDVEFTVEHGKLWMLQTRAGKRTALAAIRIAVDLFDEGLISQKEAIMLVPPQQLDQLLHPQFDPQARQDAAKYPLLATGVNASPGAAAGKVVFTAEEAVAAVEKGERVILVRHETSPDDIRGMDASQGILTSTGGKTSHAAIVGRMMGKPCVVGCSAIQIDYDKHQFEANAQPISAGDFISIDGATGEVMLGDVPTTESTIILGLKGDKAAQQTEVYQYYARFMPWADEIRTLGVQTNADTPADAQLAVLLGAEGIGLARTEHMFFGEERLPAFQRMVIAENAEERETAAAQLLPYQREDFYGILKAMDSKPVIIRLLDPPLHEFLPHEREGQEALAELTGKSVADIEDIVQGLREANPMLGHRGCRLGITFPGIYRMQVRAIFEAACQLKNEGYHPLPEVMIPVVGIAGELEIIRKYCAQVAEEVINQVGAELDYMIGTMIELPRACLVADEIAKAADFFSFGTNDLTQTTFGFSRDDVEGKFIPAYVAQQILTVSPFESIDREGVGALMQMGVEKGRATNPKLEVGICGEHGGEPASVEFCHQIGLDYVSCAPLRVPIARLAAAQAQINDPR